MKKILSVFLIFFILVWFFKSDINSFIFGNVVREVPTFEEIPQDFGDIEVLFCQVDDCERKLVEYIKKSESIDCAFFELNLEDVLDSLESKDYRLILDNSNIDRLEMTNFRSDNRSALMHNKFCIFDNMSIATGSMNPTVNGATRNDNNLVFIESLTLAGNYEDEFNEMWFGEFGKGEDVKFPKVSFNGKLIENYFCPEDNCEGHVLELLRTAKQRIYFMTFSFTSDEIGNEIIRNFYYGVDVKGIFEKTQAKSEYSEYDKMLSLGMEVKLDNNPKFMHHKVFIVDDAVVLGSYNPTSSGNKQNDENILIIHDKETADKFILEFERVGGL